MRKTNTQWLTLIVLCLTLLGCGEEQPTAPQAEEPADKPKAAEFAEVVVEINGGHLFPESEDRAAIDALQAIVEAIESDGVTIDPSYVRTGQLQLIVKPADRADAVYSKLKEQFDAIVREAVQAELATQQKLVLTTAEDVKKYQQLLQRFQQGLAVEVEVNGAQLDRRKLDRLLETTLATQIDSEKRVEALQKQIDRERDATLLRLR